MSYLVVILIALLYVVFVRSETVNRDAEATIVENVQCLSTITPCVINCNADRSCYNVDLYCPSSGDQPCTINLLGESAAERARIRTQQSPLIQINAYGVNSLSQSVIFAHTRLGSGLYLDATAAQGPFTLLSPIGADSLLSMGCVEEACNQCSIHQHSTTRVELDAMGNNAFSETTIIDIFDHPDVSLSSYPDLDTTYRAPVFLRNCGHYSNAFSFLYFREAAGLNHADWNIQAYGAEALRGARIHATSSIAPYDQSVPHVVKVYAPSADGLPANGALREFQLWVNQSALYMQVTQQENLNLRVYAADASEVSVWCLDGGDCSQLALQCPADCDTYTEADALSLAVFGETTCDVENTPVPETTSVVPVTTSSTTTSTSTEITESTSDVTSETSISSTVVTKSAVAISTSLPLTSADDSAGRGSSTGSDTFVLELKLEYILAAAGAVILILILVIVCLVVKRKKRRRSVSYAKGDLEPGTEMYSPCDGPGAYSAPSQVVIPQQQQQQQPGNARHRSASSDSDNLFGTYEGQRKTVTTTGGSQAN